MIEMEELEKDKTPPPIQMPHIYMWKRQTGKVKSDETLAKMEYVQDIFTNITHTHIGRGVSWEHLYHTIDIENGWEWANLINVILTFVDHTMMEIEELEAETTPPQKPHLAGDWGAGGRDKTHHIHHT